MLPGVFQGAEKVAGSVLDRLQSLGVNLDTIGVRSFVIVQAADFEFGSFGFHFIGVLDLTRGLHCELLRSGC